MGKKPNHNRNSSNLKAILIGTAASMAVSMTGAAITAWTVNAEKIGQNNTGIAAWIILFLASFAGTLTASKMAEGKKLQTVMLTWLTNLTTMLLITALFFGRQYSGVWVGILVSLIASLITVALNFRQGKTGNQKQWKKPYR